MCHMVVTLLCICITFNWQEFSTINIDNFSNPQITGLGKDLYMCVYMYIYRCIWKDLFKSDVHIYIYIYIYIFMYTCICIYDMIMMHT
jgi:hypothetical protein